MRRDGVSVQISTSGADSEETSEQKETPFRLLPIKITNADDLFFFFSLLIFICSIHTRFASMTSYPPPPHRLLRQRTFEQCMCVSGVSVCVWCVRWRKWIFTNNQRRVPCRGAGLVAMKWRMGDRLSIYLDASNACFEELDSFRGRVRSCTRKFGAQLTLGYPLFLALFRAQKTIPSFKHSRPHNVM